MSDPLVQAYLPLLFWPGLGLLLLRFLPEITPRLLGRGLYWVGIPLEIFVLARQTDFSQNTGLAPAFTLVALALGLGLATLGWLGLSWWRSPAIAQDFSWHGSTSATDSAIALGLQPESFPLATLGRSQQGSFILASMIGNTGFMGLAIVPNLVSEAYLGWLVFYSVTQSLIGTYGLGVMVSSYFGQSQAQAKGWAQLRAMLTVPSLWAFTIGYGSKSIALPDVVEAGLHRSLWVVIPLALLLMGMRLSQIQGWQSLRLAVVPTMVKIILIPALIGLLALGLGLAEDACLAVVLMSGMPTAFAGLILAEEYELDRDLIASSIALTSVLVVVTIPLWLVLFRSEFV